MNTKKDTPVPVAMVGASAQDKQRAIDISNLRFYSAMAHDFKWQTDIIHHSVIVQTLAEIAERLAASSPSPEGAEKDWNGARGWKYPEDVALPVDERIEFPAQNLIIAANPEDHKLPWAVILEDRRMMYGVAELSFSGNAIGKTDWGADNYWYPKMWIEIIGKLSIEGTKARIAPPKAEGPKCHECNMPLSFRTHMDHSIAVVCTGCQIELKHWPTLDNFELDVLAQFFAAPSDPQGATREQPLVSDIQGKLIGNLLYPLGVDDQ